MKNYKHLPSIARLLPDKSTAVYVSVGPFYGARVLFCYGADLILYGSILTNSWILSGFFISNTEYFMERMELCMYHYGYI